MARSRVPVYEPRKIIDARGADARGLRLRGVHRDISGNILEGRDQLSGDKVALPGGTPGVPGSDPLVPRMGPGMAWLKRQQAAGAQRSAISGQPAQSPESGTQSAFAGGAQAAGGVVRSLPAAATVNPPRVPAYPGVAGAGSLGQQMVSGVPGAGAAALPGAHGQDARATVPRVPVYAAFGGGGAGASPAQKVGQPGADGAPQRSPAAYDFFNLRKRQAGDFLRPEMAGS